MAAAGQADGGFSEIPIVDLDRQAEEAALADELRRICHEVGFFVVVNHGVPAELTDAVFAMMRRFFALPVDDKLRIDKRASRHFRGWEAEGAEYTNNRPDIREQIDVWTEWPARPADVTPEYLRLHGPNQWMPEELLPEHRRLTLLWFDALGALARRLMAIMSVGLGLADGHLDAVFGGEQMSLGKFIRYPPTPPGQMGVNAHHDAGFLTVLAAGTTPGLQVQSPDDVWVDVPVVPDSFVINLGEMLQAMTGNYFVATPHRVITATERFSAGYFHGPSLDTSLDRLPLDESFGAAVAASPHHGSAGFMARREETSAGVADMASSYKPAVYGEQLWNYFARSYPDNMATHYGADSSIGDSTG